MFADRLEVARLPGLTAYQPVWRYMQSFTRERLADTPDRCLLLEHEPVYTLGQAGDPTHILRQSSIPLVKTDRGGQVTYHGPGQVVVYPLLDLRRRNLGVRDLVSLYESVVIEVMAAFSLDAYARSEAPGVYVRIRQQEHKIAALGLRIHKGCCYHGFAVNVNVDLSVYRQINPCGYAGLAVCNLADLVSGVDVASVGDLLLATLAGQLHVSGLETIPSPVDFANEGGVCGEA